MKRLIASVFLTLCAASANAAIIYNVNRTIAEGTVTGIIETDGTLGVLDTGNILAWSLVLTSPNLNGGIPDLIEFSKDDMSLTNGVTTLNGSAVSATSTQLRYDFSISGTNHLLFLGDSGNFWCLETRVCSGGPDLTEQIGRLLIVGSEAVEWESRTGEIVFATATVVPVPAAVWLFGAGLIGLVGFARRNS